MRLICPNCGAQYEVDAAVIPDQGRDVQCSNCGHTWFQQPEHMDHEAAEELSDVGAPLDPPPTPEDAHLPPPPDAEDAAAEAPALDPDVASILREEAARETAARQAEADVIETQPDLGLDDAAEAAAERTAAARARMARLRGGDEGSSEVDPVALAGSRKELLPDVDEINSSLRPSEERDVPEPIEPLPDSEFAEPVVAETGGAGRWIFRLILLAAILAVLLYLFAQQIVEAVPTVTPYLAAYVDFVNGLRAQIDPVIEGVVSQIQGLIGGGGEPNAPPAE